MKSQIQWDSQQILFVSSEGWESLGSELQKKLLATLSDLLVRHLDFENSFKSEDAEDERKD